MTSATHALAEPTGARSRSASATASRLFLVATDGTAESDSALQIAREAAARAGANLQAISICETEPPPDLPAFTSPPDIFADPATMRANRHAEVTSQLLRVLGPGHGVWTTIRSGPVGRSIADYAKEVDCGLIVAGRGRHGIVERLMGEEHLLRLLRIARCPVLMVEAGMQPPLRRVVIGIDFSRYDQAAAEAAKDVMSADAKIFLVHVKPDMSTTVPIDGSAIASYNEAMRIGIDEVRSRLAFGASHEVEPVLLTGHPGTAIADFARRAHADLIAVGTHGTGFLHRLVVGSTTTYLLRRASCSLLSANPEEI
jgi:nucleotide-binding universal stress UspA family protein